MQYDLEKMTPMMKQFFGVKAQNPEALLLFRCGDFYESYGDDAETVSRILGIVLTRRSTGENIPMAGFPYHSLETYLPKLVRAGFKVAVCDQLEDPKLAKKIVKRGITELVTPGVAFNESLLVSRENNYIAALQCRRDQYGVAFLDVSTGQFRLSQGGRDYVRTLLDTFAPKELLVERGCERAWQDIFPGSYYYSSVEAWAFVQEAAVDRLCRQLNVESLKGFAVDRYPLGVEAAGALLVYLEQTRHAGLKNLCSLSRIDEGKFVWMDRFTLRNLEVFAPAGADGVALVDVLDHCSSPMGSRLLRQWLALPVVELDEMADRHDSVGFFKDHPEILSQLQEHLVRLGDIERLAARAATGKILPRALRQLGLGLERMNPIARLCEGNGLAALDKYIARLEDCDALSAHILSTLSEDPAALLGKGEVIAAGVDEELDTLRNLSANTKDFLLDIQRRETEETGIASLKIGYNNIYGYYLEVRNTFRDKVPADWQRKQTLVGAERYVTEELKEYESKILGAETRIYEIESRIYSELVLEVQGRMAAIQNNCAVMARLDVLSDFAAVAQERGYCRPEMTDGKTLDIIQGRHPVIETLMAPGEEYVPNDLHLDSDGQQIIILTGPNMAGKSALLRQTALIVLMAQAGSFVPAASARIGWCDKLFTRVGASDNISRGESTFMVEMLETAMILHNLSARSLVLLDEIGRGTSTYDGMSIARAIVEYIHERGQGAKTLFATHYHELNDLEGLYPRVKNFHIAVKEVDNRVIFLRKLKEGGVAHSFGLHVARMAGMPAEVIHSAQRTLQALEAEEKAGEPAGRTAVGRRKKAEAGPSPEGMQLSIFQLDDPQLSSIRDEIKSVDLNNMTPMQAFDLLRRIQGQLGL